MRVLAIPTNRVRRAKEQIQLSLLSFIWSVAVSSTCDNILTKRMSRQTTYGGVDSLVCSRAFPLLRPCAGTVDSLRPLASVATGAQRKAAATACALARVDRLWRCTDNDTIGPHLWIMRHSSTTTNGTCQSPIQPIDTYPPSTPRGYHMVSVNRPTGGFLIAALPPPPYMCSHFFDGFGGLSRGLEAMAVDMYPWGARLVQRLRPPNWHGLKV